ncbi:hypothetical protein [Mesoterricola sediminis]|uniref:Uncharacterized protein n=1 Tax=Mesoterricola sediminis TaxID=2927980 RepID=A0AA48KD43_9BACT|nr:hypothetical protein [Mesoterricola sediminis]BDU77796.1 hypothetical protein METESE_27540 [Mesoterricola sediminis]
MTVKIRRASPAVVLCVFLSAQSPYSRKVGDLLLTGEWHGSEVHGKTGERWFALLSGTDRSDVVRKATLKIDAVVDGMVDEGSQKTGKRVSIIENLGSPLFLFRKVPKVAAHLAERVSGEISLTPNSPVDLSMKNGKTYTLTLECPPPIPQGDYDKTSAKLVLRIGGRMQVLAEYENAWFHDGKFVGVGSEGEIRLLWAGDLNSDGNIDLLIDLTDHYNVSLPTLFIGISQGKGLIVTRAAQMKTTGC